MLSHPHKNSFGTLSGVVRTFVYCETSPVLRSSISRPSVSGDCFAIETKPYFDSFEVPWDLYGSCKIPPQRRIPSQASLPKKHKKQNHHQQLGAFFVWTNEDCGGGHWRALNFPCSGLWIVVMNFIHREWMARGSWMIYDLFECEYTSTTTVEAEEDVEVWEEIYSTACLGFACWAEVSTWWIRWGSSGRCGNGPRKN